MVTAASDAGTWAGNGWPAKEPGPHFGMLAEKGGSVLLRRGGFSFVLPMGMDAQLICGYGFIGDDSLRMRPLCWTNGGSRVVDLLPPGFPHGFARAARYPYVVGTLFRYSLEAPGAFVWRVDNPQAPIDITPVGAYGAQPQAIYGTDVVGEELIGDDPWVIHALLWHGLNRNPIDLNPPGSAGSGAIGIASGEEVGYFTPSGGSEHPCLWHGTASPVVDLLPPGFDFGQVIFTASGWEAGVLTDDNGNGHIGVWHGSAASFQDLTRYVPPGYSDFFESVTGAMTPNGLVVYTTATRGQSFRVLRWEQVTAGG
jgi:hypothetical protein